MLRDDKPVAVMHPEKRTYASGGQVMTEAAIAPGFTRDVYVALGEPLGGGAGPCACTSSRSCAGSGCGALLMALGGLVAASDRRFRTVRQSATSRDPVLDER